MVVPLGPGKFYGSSLPRPRYYSDVKFNSDRIDPPAPVLDPLLNWASEAHWSMGGLSFTRLRLQGKIEGNLQKLRKEQEKFENQNSTPVVVDLKKKKKMKKASINGGLKEKKRVDDRKDSPPPAPISRKTRSSLKMADEDEDVGGKKKRRRLVRKLGDDFELVATENVVNPDWVSNGVALRTRSRRNMILHDEEEDDESDEGEKSKSEKLKRVSKKNGVKGGSDSSSPSNRTRSSPRLKQKSR